MTDIYDLSDSIFVNYKNEWFTIHNTIYRAMKISGKSHSINKYYSFFKKNKPCLWNKCTDKNIYDFILRSLQISYHELIYLPSKK